MCATALVAQSNQHSSPSGDEANSDEQDETIVNTVPNLTLQGADDLTNNLQPQAPTEKRVVQPNCEITRFF